MGIAADVREQLSGLFRYSPADPEVTKRLQAAVTRLADHAEDLEGRVARLEREAKKREE